MDWRTSVICPQSSDTEPVILVTFGQAKYLFNASENTCRAFIQGRSTLGKTRAVFLNGLGPNRTAGLAGLLTTAAQIANLPKVDVVGPPGITHLLASMRCYITQDRISVQPTEVSIDEDPLPTEPTPAFRDKNVTVYAFPIQSSAPFDPTPEDTIITAATTPKITIAAPSEVSKRPVGSSPSPGLKRKRSPSPPLSPPPLELPPNASPGLTDLLKSPSFSPCSLEQPYADEYRRLIVQGIFARAPEMCQTDLDYVWQDKQPRQQKKGKKAEGRPQKKSKLSATSDPRPSGQPGLKPAARPGPSHLPATPLHNAEPAGQSPPPLADAEPIRPPRPPRPQRLPGFHRLLPAPAPGIRRSTATLGYMLVGPRVRGKFDGAKAEALGLPHGPVRARLAAGQAVVCEVNDGDGGKVTREVQPDELVGESEKPVIMLVLDVPTPDHIPSVVSRFNGESYFAQFRQCGEDGEHRMHLVSHLLGDGVLEDLRYKEFMNSFPPSTQHLFSSRLHTANPLSFVTAGQNTLRVNQLDPTTFPIPKYNLETPARLTALEGYPPTLTPFSANLGINMRPPSAPVPNKQAADADHFHPAVSGEKPLSIPPSTLALFEGLKKRVEQETVKRAGHDLIGSDVQIVALGTSSACPTLLRNMSSLLVKTPKDGNILLDAAEGTWGQLARLYGVDCPYDQGAWQVLRETKCLFLGHVHADHIGGVAMLLAKRKQLDPPPTEPLYVLGTRQVLLGLVDQAQVQNLGLHDGSVRLACTEMLHWRYASDLVVEPGQMAEQPWLDEAVSRAVAADLCNAMNLRSFTAARGWHTCVSSAAVITHQDGWKLVYSGDTMPSEDIVKAGVGATLLIHEATLADNEVQMAKYKKHSTIGQAINVGHRMKAQNVLLTHFSARYPRLPPRSTDSLGGNLALALDGAHIRIGDLWRLALYRPAIEHAMDETAEVDGVKPEEENTVALDRIRT